MWADIRSASQEMFRFFWILTPRTLVGGCQRFGGWCYLQLRPWKPRQHIWFQALTAVVILSSFRNMLPPKTSNFWDIMPCSPLKVNLHFVRTCRLHLQGPRVNQSRNQRETDSKHFSALKMDATFSSETLVVFQRTTWRYIPEDKTLWRRHIRPRSWYSPVWMHGVTTQDTKPGQSPKLKK
jgi:hypothetical protein